MRWCFLLTKFYNTLLLLLEISKEKLLPEEKGFREIRCAPPCGKRLRFPVGPYYYGKTVKVRCSVCSFENTTVIPHPPKEEAPKKPFRDLSDMDFRKTTRDFSTEIDDMFGSFRRKKRT